MYIPYKAYTPAIPPHWTDFPCADTYVHAEVAPVAAGLTFSSQGLQLTSQSSEPRLVLLLWFPLELLPGGQADHHLVHRTVAEQGKVLEGWLVVPSHLRFHLLQLTSLLHTTRLLHCNQTVTQCIITFGIFSLH